MIEIKGLLAQLGRGSSFLTCLYPYHQAPAIFLIQDGFPDLNYPKVGQHPLRLALFLNTPLDLKMRFFSGGSLRMWTSGQSGTCSPALPAGVDQTSDIPMSDAITTEFAFGSNVTGLVKTRKGEKIHKVCVADDLKLNCTWKFKN
ncbi:hypothetical protein REPUB_Repub09cG0045400 [Reevesia pubescens]